MATNEVPMPNSREQDGARVKAQLAQARLLVMDVDGVLTDGTIGYSSDGAEQRRFHVADGVGIVALRQIGITVAWISGRANTMVERRAAELGVYHVLQNVREKGGALQRLAGELSLESSQIAYIADDWNDLPAFEVAGTRIAVADAAAEVKAGADYVTERSGGQGAVREVCEAILEARGAREACLRAYLDYLRTS
jgi:3-deoxy-D-manno-octulosonate 8-phosphate phosphatase (KDO 8-P phosphatase)